MSLMHRSLLPAVAGLVLLQAPLAAQQPRRAVPAPAATPAASSLGSVRGVVFDSLLGAPLEGARVYINGTSFAALTDAGGRFRLDSVPPGRQLIAFEHPDLDSVGFSNNAQRIQVAAGRPTVVTLAVPSLNTMRRAVCVSSVAPGRDSGVVFGAVTDAERGRRLGGARVLVAWTTAGRAADGRVQVGRPVLEAQTDSLGNYYICNVPSEIIVTTLAQAGRFVSGLTELLLGTRAIARRDIAVTMDSSAYQVDSTGVRRGRATIVGTVVDDYDRPRPSARATVDDTEGEGFANEAGRFILGNMPAGSQTLMVRMIGYSAVRLPVLLRNDDTTRVSVTLRALTVLDTLRVTASNRGSENEMSQLQLRMRSGFGYFLRGEDVKNRSSMRAVLQGLPALTVEGRSTYNFRLLTLVNGSPCPVFLYVDGIRTSTEAIQSYRPDQLVAVEWYRRGAQAPVKYQSAGASTCAVMLIWTRFM